MLGIGIDVLRMSRVEKMVQRLSRPWTLAAKILSPREIIEFKAESDPWNARDVQYLSTRFAIKEAAFKAVFPYIQLGWKDLSVIKNRSKPYLVLENMQKREYLERKKRFSGFEVSVSHDGDIVVAVVVANGD